MYPNRFLSRQFWTEKQRIDALDGEQRKKIESYGGLGRSLLVSADSFSKDKRISQICVDCLNQVSVSCSDALLLVQPFCIILFISPLISITAA